MSTIIRRAAYLFPIFFTLVLDSRAATPLPEICGIVLGEQVDKIPRAFFDLKSVDPVPFVPLGQPGLRVLANRFEVRIRKGCQELSGSETTSQEAPNLILDVVDNRVVAFTFRPLMQDCESVKIIISSILGPSSYSSAEISQWEPNKLRRVILTSYRDDFCWISQQELL